MEGTQADKSGIHKYIRELLARFSVNDDVNLHYVLYPEKGIGQAHYEPTFLAKLNERDRWLKSANPIAFPVATNTIRTPGQGLWFSPINSLPPIAITQSVPRILVVHDVIHLKGHQYWDMERRPPIEAAIDSISLERDFVICDSFATRREFLKVCPLPENKAYVVPLAYDQSCFCTPNPELCVELLQERGLQPGKFVLVLGQMEKRKNLRRFLEAFARMHSAGVVDPLPLLVVLQHSSAREQVEKYVADQGIERALVRFVDNVTEEMLASLYACAACFSYVSLEEGFGLPILEAMASGCSVLTSNCSSMEEVAGGAAELCDAVDVGSIQRGLERLLSHPEFRASLVAKGRNRARSFSWDRVAGETLDIMKEVVAASGESDPSARSRHKFWQSLGSPVQKKT